MNPSAKNIVQSRSIPLDEVRELSRRDAGKLFAILDASAAPIVTQLVAQLAERATCLYAGPDEHKYWNTAPFLVRLDEKLLEWVRGNLFGKPWGIFLFAPSSMNDVRQHLSRYVTKEHPAPGAKHSQFYDPRNLPEFLRFADEASAKEFFGPVSQFIAGQKEKDLVCYELSPGSTGSKSTP